MSKPATTRDVRVDVHVTPEQLRAALRDDVARGLRAAPKDLPPKWFYDDRGSQLFDEITRLPEYYPTRRERAILISRADDIAALSQADTLVELGSGTSEKTRLLLDAFVDTVPPDLWITSFEDRGASLKISGTAYSTRAVSEFLNNLRQSGKFKDVDIIVSRQDLNKNPIMVTFEVTCRFEV